MNPIRLLAAIMPLCFLVTDLAAHDTWIEPESGSVPTGEYCYIDLMLGNHGNNHRDFKLASKITLTHCTLEAFDPSGNRTDLKPALIDMGSADKEGYWTARFDFEQQGWHRFVHTLDTLHRTTRAIKSAKTFVLATGSERATRQSTPVDKCDELGLELVLKTDPNRIAAEQPMQLQVTRSGKPLSAARVAFIPRGKTLHGDFDKAYERISDADGIVQFTPREGNVVLAIVHHLEPEESGEVYDKTHYSAAIVIRVPNKVRAD